MLPLHEGKKNEQPKPPSLFLSVYRNNIPFIKETKQTFKV
jgi:hypothetical protein